MIRYFYCYNRQLSQPAMLLLTDDTRGGVTVSWAEEHPRIKEYFANNSSPLHTLTPPSSNFLTHTPHCSSIHNVINLYHHLNMLTLQK